MINNLSLQEWANATVQACCETIVQTLSLDAIVISEMKNSTDSLMPDLSGAFLSLVTESDAVQVGFFSTHAGLSMLAKTMMGMGEDEELPAADIADAIGEIVNVFGGGVKKRLNEQTSGIKLGLPIFVEGKIAHGGSQEVAVINIQIDSALVHLVIIRKKG